MKTARLVRRRGPRNRGDLQELVWRCDGCGYYLVTRGEVDLLSRASAIQSWCPCLPWDIRAVRLGMMVKKKGRKGANRVVGIDRSNGRVILEDGTDPKVESLEPL